jgi:hypothetical protein
MSFVKLISKTDISERVKDNAPDGQIRGHCEDLAQRNTRITLCEILFPSEMWVVN